MYMFVIAFVSAACAGHGQSTEVVELIEHAWDQRRSLESGKLSMDVIRSRDGADRTIPYEITFSGDDLRVEFIDVTTSHWSSGEVSVSPHRSKLVFRSDAVIVHIEADRPTAARIDYLEALGERERRRLVQRPHRIDPRLLGIFPNQLGAIGLARGLDYYLKLLSNSRVTSTSVETIDADIEAKRLSFQTDVDELWTIWIAEEHEFSVMRSALTTKRDGRVYEYIVSSKMGKFDAKNGRILFPREVVFELVEDHIRISKEEVHVKEAVFNSPFDASVFTLAGMDIPAGTFVRENPTPAIGTRVWDGKNLVPMRELPTATQISLRGGVSARRVLAIVMTLCAFLILSFWIVRHRVYKKMIGR